MKFSQIERGGQQFFCCFQGGGGIKNLTESFIPFLPPPPPELKNDNSQRGFLKTTSVPHEQKESGVKVSMSLTI